MKAVVVSAPQRALLADEPVPRPGPGRVLVRVAAAGVCMSDVELWRGTRPAPFVRYPIVPGHEWCGTVEEAGPGVESPRVGDRVAVEGHNYCRECARCRRGETNLCATYDEHGFTRPGGFAEFAAVRADLAHRFAPTLPFEAAALTEPFACVVHGVRRAPIEEGATVAVLGPGTLGLLCVGRAKAAGAARIVVVGLDRGNEAVARAMGATDFATVSEDPKARILDVTAGRGADVVLEAAGSAQSVPLALDVARRGGTVALLGIAGGNRRASIDADVFTLRDLRVHGVFAYTSRDFAEALALIESGRIDVRPLVTHSFPLARFAEAFELLGDRREPAVKVLLRP